MQRIQLLSAKGQGTFNARVLWYWLLCLFYLDVNHFILLAYYREEVESTNRSPIKLSVKTISLWILHNSSILKSRWILLMPYQIVVAKDNMPWNDWLWKNKGTNFFTVKNIFSYGIQGTYWMTFINILIAIENVGYIESMKTRITTTKFYIFNLWSKKSKSLYFKMFTWCW